MGNKVLKCDNCGESLSSFNPGLSYCKCKYCNSINFIFDDNKVNLLDQARASLVLFKFDDADLIYKKLIDENSDNLELLAKCYEGRIKATLGICYIKSFTENTYKPTFTHYVPSIKSIYDLDECKKLFSLKLKDSVRKEYQERIEEWDKEYKNIAKQLKEKPDYDIFICTKISLKTKDNPNAIGYTEDFKEALTLYNELKECGYKVFLSSECVKGGIDSDAEIFSALTKSRSLLVIGSKQEYLESAWVESEWRRWLYFIDHKQKETKSIFLYTCGIDLKLPMIMDQKRIQRNKSSLDIIKTIKGYLVLRGETTLGTIDLKEKSIVKKIRNKEKIDRSELISVQNIKDSSNLEIDKQLDNIESDLPTSRRNRAIVLLGQLTDSNPNYSRIIALNILVEYGFNKLNDLFEINNFEKIEDLDVFKTILENGGSKEFLHVILDILYNYLKKSNSQEKSLKILNIILPYKYDGRKELIDQLYEFSLQNSQVEMFNILLSQKEFSNEQEIEELIKFSDNALNSSKFELANKTANKILNEYEEGNAKAKEIVLLSNHGVKKISNLFTTKNVAKQEFIDELIDILSYIPKNNRLKLIDSWNEIILSKCIKMNDKKFEKFYDEFLKFYPQEKNKINVQKERIEKAARILQNNGEFQKALHYYEFLVAISEDTVKIYWQMMLCDLNCFNEEELYTKLISIEDNKYYNQAYKLVEHGSEFEKHIQQVRNKQLDALEKNLKNEQQKELKQKETIKNKKKMRIFLIIAIVLLSLIIISSVLSLFKAPVFSGFYKILSISCFNEFKIEYVILPVTVLLLIYLIIVLIHTLLKKINYFIVGLSYVLFVLVVGGGIFGRINFQSDSSNMIVNDDCIIKFERTKDGYEVNRIYLISKNVKIEIPEKFNNEPVISIGSNLVKKNNNYLKEIVIPNSIEEISSGALKSCNSLEKLTIPFIGNNSNDQNSQLNYIFSLNRHSSINQDVPESLKYIEVTNANFINDYTFSDCESLETIIIPEQVETIGEYAFSNCNNLKEIKLPSSLIRIGSNALTGCSSLKYNEYGNCLYLENEDNPYFVLVKAKDDSITEETIPNNTRIILNNAFLGCTSLTSLVIPSSITSIGEGAFYNCSELSAIIFEEGSKLADIGNGAFADCSSLTSITIPNSVTGIGNSAFRGCSFLIIFCEEISKPSGWDENWNGGRTVCWGVTKEDIIFQNGIKYLIIDGCVVVTGYTNELPNDAVIPSTIAINETTYGVKSIVDSAFADCSSLTSITIPNSVTNIEDNAFYYCSELSTITFEEGSKLADIGNGAFSGCSSLTSITIPNSVTSIGNSVFYNCSSFESLTLPYLDTYFGYYFGASSYNENSSYVPSSLKEVIIIGESNIPDYAFSGCSFLTSITIPNNVTSIGNSAFYNCSSLESLTLPYLDTYFGYYFGASSYNENSCYVPSSLKEVIIIGESNIPDYAFADCSSLTSITILNSATNIGYSAFLNCSFLESLTLRCLDTYFGYYFGGQKFLNGNSSYVPSSLKEVIIIGESNIPDYYFSDCSSLTSITISNSVTSIGENAFYNCSELSAITFEEGSKLADIGNGAFADCSSLTSITIPNSVTSIGDNTFYNCSELSAITFEGDSKLADIGNDAFQGCSSLTSITIPNSVTSIGDNAFRVCSSLTSITIPNSVTSIGENAFYNCSELSAIIFEEGSKLADIGNGAFSGCSSLISIIIPNSVTTIGSSAFTNCSSLTIYCEASSQPSGFDSSWNYDYRPVYWGVAEEDITYQNGIQYLIINGNAVATGYTNELPNNVVIPSTITISGAEYSVTSIGEYAFSDCSSLTSIVIPNSVTSIGYFAFSRCSFLTSLVIPNSVTTIGSSAFTNCSSLSSIVIPNSVTNIGRYAFNNCSSLSSIVIPNSVTTIGSSAFNNCSSLTIYCEASSQPSGWNYRWNQSNRPVYWNGDWSYVNGVPTPNKF